MGNSSGGGGDIGSERNEVFPSPDPAFPEGVPMTLITDNERSIKAMIIAVVLKCLPRICYLVRGRMEPSLLETNKGGPGK
jgi:hypothetical protein